MQNLSENVAPLPSAEKITTIPVLEALGDAREALGELRGRMRGLSYQGIPMDTLYQQEALASSAIENIVITLEEAFRAFSLPDIASPKTKEVVQHFDAMEQGYADWREMGGISESMFISMFRILKQRGDGYRTQPGTKLINLRTREVVYEPPQDPHVVVQLMRELESFINAEANDGLHPLVRMALIHHRFESIHPFPDGNGRIGRILNLLYLIHTGLLDAPTLYLSRAIYAARPDYYRLLQGVRTEDAWEDWVIYLLNAVTRTARSTMKSVESLRKTMLHTKKRMREELPKVYSQDLLNNLFRYPYTRIELLAKDIAREPQTARRYLKELTKKGFVREVKHGRNNFYINDPLVALLTHIHAGGVE
ncbi:MAG: Fic family protein [Betaproteobacteria bacterium AqS2]|uniref:Protein adenylyltransferase n=1 Tax=Candidatus Amphirhobacter heronislandensis TaxID=1732024 RepID=A0A930UB65_9GAMM|nr:Fic family protein [Betaproteobacteria bacterium AqS2]